jgi:anti-sigma factor RsiW
MTERQLRQSDFEELSAYFDGELSVEAARRIEELVRSDPDWGKAHREIQAIDSALDACEVPPARADLAGRILRKSHKADRGVLIRLEKWLAPLAAAAAIVLALLLFNRTAPVSTELTTEVLARDNLDFFQEYDVVVNLDTLEAIEELEVQGSGT